MKIAVTSQNGDGDFQFENSGPWLNFKYEIENRGGRLVSIYDSPDFLIFNNTSPGLIRKLLGSISANRCVLVAWEPPSNLPFMYSPHVLNLFSQRWFPSSIWSVRYRGRHFYWPQSSEMQVTMEDWDSRINRFCIIQGNRWGAAAHSFYDFRREVLTEFGSEIDLYGYGWNSGFLSDSLNLVKSAVRQRKLPHNPILKLKELGKTYKNYQGVALNKREVYKRYKLSIVIENSEEYVSEKLVDAILSGTVPIYIGADLEKFDFPKDIAFSTLPRISDLRELMNYVKVNPIELEKKIISGQTFLNSEKFNQMKNEKVLTSLAGEIMDSFQSA